MPLPDAEDAKKSNLYAQLRSSQLDSVTQDNFDKVKDPVYFNAAFEDEARRLKLWGEIAGKLSSSGPLPGTQIVQDTTGITNSYLEVYRPAVGTVYQLIAASIITLDTAASMILNIEDADGNRVQIDTFNATSNPLELNEPIFVTYEAWLSVRTSDASAGNARLGTSLIRVR